MQHLCCNQVILSTRDEKLPQQRNLPSGLGMPHFLTGPVLDSLQPTLTLCSRSSVSAGRERWTRDWVTASRVHQVDCMVEDRHKACSLSAGLDGCSHTDLLLLWLGAGVPDCTGELQHFSQQRLQVCWVFLTLLGFGGGSSRESRIMTIVTWLAELPSATALSACRDRGITASLGAWPLLSPSVTKQLRGTLPPP